MGERMDREFLGIVVLLGLLLVTMAITASVENYFVVPLSIKMLIGIGVFGSLIWVIVVMPRLMGE